MRFTTFWSVLYSCKVFIVKLSVFLFPSLTLFSQFFYQMKGTENTYKQKRAITEQVQHLKRMAIFFFTLK